MEGGVLTKKKQTISAFKIIVNQAFVTGLNQFGTYQVMLTIARQLTE